MRYGIAQSGISQDNMPGIIDQLEKVIKKEKRPTYKALLYLFEAMVYDGYCDRYASYRDRNNPVEQTSTDVSEWSREQFEGKILQLLSKALENPEALKEIPVYSMPDILVYNDLGVLYTPTLLEFMSRECYDMLGSNRFGNSLREQIKDRWLETTQDNMAAHSVLIALVGIGLATVMYLKENPLPERMANSMRGLWTASYKRFYMDELYQFITHKVIFQGLCVPIAWFDRHIIDGFMNLLADATNSLSFGIRRLQSGSIQAYVYVYLLGALLLAAITMICVIF